VLLLGKAQDTGIPAHRATVERLAREFANSGEYEYITMNRAWRTTTGRENALVERPDIICVKPNGTVDAFEVVSPSQTHSEAIAKLEAEMLYTPEPYRGAVRTFDIDPQ
jgi:hypothetical protein